MSNIVVKVENLSKRYRLGLVGGKTLREDIQRLLAKCRGKPDPLLKIASEIQGNLNDEILWALRDVSFDVQRGEILGIIGKNGAGKSTLLKILSRITAPSHGRIKIKGRVGSLLEVGTGFHPELTGRENTYLNGAILGMSKSEVDQKIDRIIEFAEIDKFADTPVKRYSSGMYVRLAFAVAAHLEPEILIVDEVLAVGDANFQSKCLGKMKDVSGEGRTVLFVSHNMGAIESICEKSILLSKGTVKMIGPSANIVSEYLNISKSNTDLSLLADQRSGNGKVRVDRIDYKNSHGKITDQFQCGDDIQIVIRYVVKEKLVGASLKLTIYTDRGVAVSHFNTEVNGHPIDSETGEHQVICAVENLNLATGSYHLNMGIQDMYGLSDHVIGSAPFIVSNSNYLGTGKLPDPRYGLVVFRSQWKNVRP